ncbi:hypothetical protein IF1G_07864 [Cordyceps javanica]|uniref:Uncharacterized protein n=1 Tax=Cordyceps javanica TaxID=43265 RepID=A0A545UV14_9HYPO|nr:hypothetical protein IF1G_07864 [Cordyceps javanica]TQW05357.1 hypothetical protein IF2G_07294 [Cordyceps javanica]
MPATQAPEPVSVSVPSVNMHSYSKIGGSSDFAARYPTRILVGYWLYSSEPEPDQHAVYGILSRDGKLRFKLVSETRDGKNIRGNYPPPSETWLIHEEIVLLPHLLNLNRLGMKEYCRERGRQVTAGEDAASVEANVKKAVEYAERISTTGEGQRPRNLRWEREKCADRQRAIRKIGTASAHAKAMHEKAHGIKPASPPSDLDLSHPVQKPPSHHRTSSSTTTNSKKRRSASPLAADDDDGEPMSAADRDGHGHGHHRHSHSQHHNNDNNNHHHHHLYKPPSPRVRGHRLPNDRPVSSSSSSFRAANVKVDEETDRLPPLKAFCAANGLDDKERLPSLHANGLDDKERLPPLHATLACDAMDLDDKERLPPIQAIAPKSARQPLPQQPYVSPPAPRKALPTSAAHGRKSTSAAGPRAVGVASPPTGDEDDDLDDDEPRSTVFNGVTYVRRTNGSFRGKLVSPGKIITIEGQDYVEYCVLAKLSFV